MQACVCIYIYIYTHTHTHTHTHTLKETPRGQRLHSQLLGSECLRRGGVVETYAPWNLETFNPPLRLRVQWTFTLRHVPPSFL